MVEQRQSPRLASRNNQTKESQSKSPARKASPRKTARNLDEELVEIVDDVYLPLNLTDNDDIVTSSEEDKQPHMEDVAVKKFKKTTNITKK